MIAFGKTARRIDHCDIPVPAMLAEAAFMRNTIALSHERREIVT